MTNDQFDKLVIQSEYDTIDGYFVTESNIYVGSSCWAIDTRKNLHEFLKLDTECLSVFVTTPELAGHAFRKLSHRNFDRVVEKWNLKF